MHPEIVKRDRAGAAASQPVPYSTHSTGGLWPLQVG